MGETFYRVGFVGLTDNYYFHNKENAVAFLLESYFDDFGVGTEVSIIDKRENIIKIKNANFISLFWLLFKISSSIRI